MDHPYSFWADVLSKFQGSTPWIQALWLVLTAAVAMGVVWCVADAVKAVVRGLRRGEPNGRLVYGLVQDRDGRWLVYEQGEVRALEGAWGEAARDPWDGSRTAILPPQS